MPRALIPLFFEVLASCRSAGGPCDHPATWWPDRDGDGFGDEAEPTSACDHPFQFVDNALDCDDAAAAVHPGATEICNGEDDDCDGTTEPAPATWFADHDGDGYGAAGDTTTACEQPAGLVAVGDDCDDANASVHPTATEVCNGVDDDCANGIDDPFDADGDGHAGPGCKFGDDCDDGDPEVHPGADDACEDGIDNDCLGGDAVCTAFSGDLLFEDADSKSYSVGPNEELGRVFDVGDVNGDGELDVFGGAQFMNTYHGGGYVLYGPLDGTHLATDVGHRLENTTDHPMSCGRSVSVGDIDGDGYDDVGLGGYDGLRIEFGPIDSDIDLADADIYAFGPAYSMYGHGHDLADVNGDGQADLIGGGHTDPAGAISGGAVYVLFGPLGAGEEDVGADHDVALVDGAEGDQGGRTVRVGGDFNADGAVDTMIQSQGYAPAAGGIIHGAAYVVYGPIDSDRPLDEPDAILASSLPSSQAGEAMGQGDADGDGISDAVVGASQATPDGTPYAGSAYVVLGPISGIVDLDASADFVVRGASVSGHLGDGVALGDVTGDGRDDLAVGMPGPYPKWAGAAYFFEAPLSGTATVEDATADFAGEQAEDGGGTAVFLADLDHDGACDLLASSPYDATSGTMGGAIYTFLSR